MNLKILSLFVSIFLASLIASNAMAEGSIEKFVESLDSCQTINFSSIGYFSQYSPESLVNSSAVRDTIGGPGTYGRVRMGQGVVLRAEYLFPFIEFQRPKKYETAAYNLIDTLEASYQTGVSYKEFIQVVDQKLADNLKTYGKAGCIHVRVAAGAGAEVFPQLLGALEMDRIRDLFLRRENPIHLGLPLESEMISSGRLTRDELIELRGLRRASKIVGQATIIKYDKGGYLGNIAIGSKVRMRCQDVAFTYLQFFKTLEIGHFLESFEVLGQEMHREMKYWPDGHLAVGLLNKRTKEIYVFDAYHLDGGSAGQIVTLNDWLSYNDFANVADEQ